MRKIGTSTVEIDSTNIIKEDDDELVLPGVLARECVLRYPQGMAFRPAAELKRSLFTFEGAWIVNSKHPETRLLTDLDLISGKVDNVVWDEEKHEVRGHVHIDKSKAKPEFLAVVKAGLGKNSVCFHHDEDWVKGEFNGQHYDYVQRKLLIDHIAVGVPNPRDPGCVLGVDTEDFSAEMKIAVDPEVTENYVRIRVRDPDLFVDGSFRTIVLSADQGVHAIIGKLKSDPNGSTVIQNYMFELSKDWTMEKAQAWVEEHKQDALEVDAEADSVLPKSSKPAADALKEIERSRRLLES